MSELEQRARTSLSWRDRFDRSPGLMLGVAFGGGLLLSKFWASGGGSNEPPSLSQPRNGQPRARGPGLDAVVGALLAAGAGRAVKYLGDRVPEFRDELASQRPTG